jgi:phosphate transport system substrate-binding protein
MKRSWIRFGLGVLAAVGLGSAMLGCGGNKPRLDGAGSSFAAPMMEQWAKVYNKEKGIEINYQSKGSSAGIEMMTDRSVDFGSTDAPMNPQQLQKASEAGGAVVHIPLLMGAAVPAYNLKQIEQPLRFTGPVLADIFRRKIKKWNDPALVDLNPGVPLPGDDIKVVHRADGSGTTYMWTEYLSKVSPEWKKEIDFGTSVKWPEGTVGEKGTEGVANYLATNPGSIGYIELIYARKNKIPYGSIQNREKNFVLGSLESVTAAAEGALSDIPDDLRYSITNAPGKESYPVSGTTWAVVYVNQPSDKGQRLVDCLKWMTHQGQDMLKDLDYARLPQPLIERIDKKLSEIKVGK